MSSTFRALRAVLVRLSRREPAQLVLIITALLFGCTMLVGSWPVLSQIGLIMPTSPTDWSAVQVLTNPTTTPTRRDERICSSSRLYPTGTGQWYDVCLAQVKQNALYVSVLAANFTLVHGPSDVGEPYPDCDSSVLPSHDLVLLCRDNSSPGSGPQALRLHIVDQLGRPHTPITISGQGDHTALAVDPSGRLHIAWLDPQSGDIWTVHYATYSADPAVLDSGAVLPADDVVGVIHLTADHLLLGFALGIDARNTYIIWNDNNNAGSDSPGIVYALTFASDKLNEVKQITVSDAMRSFSSVLTLNDHAVVVALVGSPTNSAPAVAFLVNGKTARIDTFSAPFAEFFHEPSLSLRVDGSLQIQWSVWTSNQGEILYSATTRAFP